MFLSFQTLGEYSFGYNEDHTSGGSFRRETSDRLGNKVGSYGLRIGDGRVRVVNYVADHNGFRADVLSNEPGMAQKKNIYTVLVPGFKYSSGAPYVSFESEQQQQPLRNVYDIISGKAEQQQQQQQQTQQQFEVESTSPEGEELGEVYAVQGDQDEEPASIFVNDGGNFGQMYTEARPELGNIYIQEGQMPEDVFMDGEYSHESETVLNQTTNAQMEVKETDVTASTESGVEDTPSTDDLAANDNSQDSLVMSSENDYHESVANVEDLHSSQSNTVLSQSNEQLNPIEYQNTTWNDDVTNISEEEE